MIIKQIKSVPVQLQYSQLIGNNLRMSIISKDSFDVNSGYTSNGEDLWQHFFESFQRF
jgi:hypothetical protein